MSRTTSSRARRGAIATLGTLLLGAIIEEVTGGTWHEYIVEELLRPAGIQTTDYDLDEAVGGPVRGYRNAQQGAPSINMAVPHAAGALSATAADVDHWQRALHGGQILSEEMVARMTNADEAATDIGPVGVWNYGYGLYLGTLQGRPLIYHTGAIAGSGGAAALWLPEEAISVVVLSNNFGLQPGPATLAFRLAAVSVGDPYPVELPTVPISVEELAPLEGFYRIDEETIRNLRVVEGELVSRLQRGPEARVRPVAEDTFVFGSRVAYFEVERDNKGNVAGLRVYQQGDSEGVYEERIDNSGARTAIHVAPEILEVYGGEYELTPQLSIVVTVEDGALFAQGTGQPRVPLVAESETEFFARAVDAQVTFQRNENGEVTGLILHQGGREMLGDKVRN